MCPSPGISVTSMCGSTRRTRTGDEKHWNVELRECGKRRRFVEKRVLPALDVATGLGDRGLIAFRHAVERAGGDPEIDEEARGGERIAPAQRLHGRRYGVANAVYFLRSFDE